METTLMDVYWLESYSVSYIFGFLTALLDLGGEDMVREYCPDITDELLAALKKLGKDCTDDEYNLFGKRYENDIMKMQIYEKAYARAEKALEAKNSGVGGNPP